jgi:hypothetical protein
MNNDLLWKNYFSVCIGNSSLHFHVKQKGTWKQKTIRASDIWKLSKKDFEQSVARCFSQNFPFLLDGILKNNPFQLDYGKLDFSPLHSVVAKNDVDFANVCVKYGFSVKLLYGLKSGKVLKSIEELVKSGQVSMDISIVICPEALNSPSLLFDTIQKYQGKKLQSSILRLIETGNGINEKQETFKGYTPLHLTAVFGLPELLKSY